MNVFRNKVFKGLTGATVIVATVVSFILPFGDDSFVSEHLFKNLFGDVVDLRVDDEFLTSWEAAHLSDADSIGQFIDAFLASYGNTTRRPVPPTGMDTHALWTILKGVSINLDPPAVPNHIISTLRTAVQTVTAPGISVLDQSSFSLPTVRLNSDAAFVSASGIVRSLMTNIQRQGP